MEQFGIESQGIGDSESIKNKIRQSIYGARERVRTAVSDGRNKFFPAVLDILAPIQLLSLDTDKTVKNKFAAIVAKVETMKEYYDLNKDQDVPPVLQDRILDEVEQLAA